MLFKFDRDGNMEDIENKKGDNDMVRKGKNVVAQVDNTVNKENSMNINDDKGDSDMDMIQQLELAEGEIAVGFESFVEEAVDGNSDGTVDENKIIGGNSNMSNGNVINFGGVINNKTTDEEMQQYGSEALLKMGNLDKIKDDEDSGKDNDNQEANQEDKGVSNVVNMGMMPSLSNKTRMEGEKENNMDKEVVLKIENCYPVYRFGKIHKWMTAMTAEQINNAYLQNQIYYDFEVQRGFKRSAKGELKPLVTSRHIDEILKKMLSNKIAGGALTLCYFKENEEELEYDETTNTIICRNSLAVVDGGHRLFSCMKMVNIHKKDQSKPNPAEFEYLTKEEGMALFSEYANAGKKIGKNKSEALNVFDNSHKISEEIIKNSELNNKIEMIASSPKENNIMLFSTLMNGVRIFKSKTKKDELDTSNFLSNFWSELIYLFKDEMGNMDYKERKEIRKQTFLLEPMFLMGMFNVAKTLMDLNLSDEEWIAKLKKLKEDANFFLRENQIWDSIKRTDGATINTSKTQKTIIDEMVKKVLS